MLATIGREMHTDLMLDSLAGLSVGDALGQKFPVMGRSIAEILAAAHSGCGSGPGRIGVPQAWVATREPLLSWISAVRAQRRNSRLGFGRVRGWFVSDRKGPQRP